MHHAHIDMLTYYVRCLERGTGRAVSGRESPSHRASPPRLTHTQAKCGQYDPNLCMQTIWRPAIARPHRDVPLHKLLRKAHDRIDEHSLSHGARSPCWRARLTCAQRRRNKDEAGRGLVSAGVNHHDFARPKGACPLKRDRRANRAELPPAVAFTRSLPRGMAGRRERW